MKSAIKNGDFGDFGDHAFSNTKKRMVRLNQLKRWFFTYNNYEMETLETLETVFKRICSRYVFQQEIGENGTRHLQGGLWLKKDMRPSEFDWPPGYKWNEIHWEKQRSEVFTYEYCTKEDTRLPNTQPIIYGDFSDLKIKAKTLSKPQLILIENLRPWQKYARDLLTKECTTTTNRTINWITDTTGNSGKSAFSKYMYCKHNTLVIQGGKHADIMNIIFNANMDTCKSVIIDIPRSHTNHVSYSAIECILNGMITNTKYETGIKVFNPPQVLILANFDPIQGDEIVSEDRWNIINICDIDIIEIEIEDIIEIDVISDESASLPLTYQ